MSKKKSFNTQPFRGLAEAVYKMHRTLITIKKIFNTSEGLEEMQVEAILEYANKMEDALERAKVYGGEWLHEIREKLAP